MHHTDGVKIVGSGGIGVTVLFSSKDGERPLFVGTILKKGSVYMDVGNTTKMSQIGLNVYAKMNGVNGTKTSSTTTTPQSATSDFGAAYSVDISKTGQQAAQEAADAEQDQQTQGTTKGLTSEQVDALKADIDYNQQVMLNLMIQALQDTNDRLQGWLDEGTGVLNFGGVQVDASMFGMPEVATNPEDAAKAVADGGDWSVDAVATRIFDLASTIAGNDPTRLEEMRAAVEEGFRQAGVTWSDATGQKDMPEITSKTYDEIMSRFDARAKELSGGV